MAKYYTVQNTEGETFVQEYESKERLLEAIDYLDTDDFLDKMPGDIDTNYWHGDMLIIKGNIVTPKAKEIVTKYTID